MIPIVNFDTQRSRLCLRDWKKFESADRWQRNGFLAARRFLDLPTDDLSVGIAWQGRQDVELDRDMLWFQVTVQMWDQSREDR